MKLKRSGGLAYSAHLDKHCYDSKPADHWKASESVAKVVVFGIQAKASGIWVPNELIAEYVQEHPEKVEGSASVDPTPPDCIEQLEYCVKTLKLKGLKLGPVYQHFDPQDRQYWPFFRKVQQLGLPDHVASGHDVSQRGKTKVGPTVSRARISLPAPCLNIVAGLRAVNKPVEGTGLPKVPVEVQDMILYENWKAFFPHWA